MGCKSGPCQRGCNVFRWDNITVSRLKPPGPPQRPGDCDNETTASKTAVPKLHFAVSGSSPGNWHGPLM